MARKSPCYYIAPSAISISPNANGSANDLAVNVTRGTKIKVFSQGIAGLGWKDTVYQQWTLTGRNRRLADSTKPYTIYARLNKSNKEDGYLVFAPKEADKDGNWLDKYAYVTMQGLATGTANKNVSDYWYVKLGEVSLPTDNARTVSLDTGILGTDQFNTEWNLHPDDMPLRVELSATIDLKDAGSKPYVPWGKKLVLRAKLLQGWADTTIPRFHHFTIQRNTGDTDADKTYNYPDGNSEVQSSGRQMSGGNIILSHARGEGDVFNGTVSSAWTVIAWGTKATADGSVPSSSASSSDTTETYERLAETTTSISAETTEQFSLELSSAVVNYDPSSDTYNPSEGVDVMIRAIDQKGEVFKLTNAQRKASSLAIQYCVGEEAWNTCKFDGKDTEVAKTNIPKGAFTSQQNVNVRIVRVVVSTGQTATTTYKELDRTHIPLVRNGEDSKEREWIFLRSTSAIQFSSDVQDTTKPLVPSLIAGGEVKPEEAATGDDTNKNQDGWVPEGWWDEMRGTDSEHHYEYAAYRDYIKGGVPDNSSSSSASSESSSDPSKSGNAAQRGGHWGDFSTPRIWGYYAEDAVSYRCRWTLAGVEVYQLKCAYTGAFRGTLPLVATLLKRVGSGQEQEVKGKTVITLKCEGIDYSKTFNTDNPTFTVNTTDANTADFVQYLNKVELNGLSVSFTVNGEEHNFSIPVIREADEDSVKGTIDTYGSQKFLRKDQDDTTEHKLTMGEAEVTGNAKVGGKTSMVGGATVGDGTYGIDKDGIATLAGEVAEYLKSKDFNTDNPRFGSGLGMLMKDGVSYGYIDYLTVRTKMTAEQLEVRVLSRVAGDYAFTKAGSHIVYVEVKADRYRCYYTQDDGTTQTINNWQVGDFAKCKTSNIKTGKSGYTATRYYNRLVIAASSEPVTVDGLDATKKYGYIDLAIDDSNTIEYPYTDSDGNSQTAKLVCTNSIDGEDVPQAQDDIVQWGNAFANETQYTKGTFKARGNVLLMSVSEGGLLTYTQIDHPVDGSAMEQYMTDCILPTMVRFSSDHFIIAPYAQRDAADTVICFRDDWNDKMVCGHNDVVRHSDKLWQCIVNVGETTNDYDEAYREPKLTSPIWKIYVKGIPSAGKPVLTIAESTGEAMYVSDTDIVTLKVQDALAANADADITSGYGFSVSRNSGNTDADTVWNTAHASIATNTFELTADDLTLAAMTQAVTFTVTAKKGDSILTMPFVKRLTGKNDLRIEFSSNVGPFVSVSRVDLQFTGRIMFGDEDITATVLADSRNTFVWTRDSGIESEDKSWVPTILTDKDGTQHPNILCVHQYANEPTGRKDCGSQWEKRLQVKYTLTATIYTDTTYNAKTVTLTESTGIASV